MYDKLIKDVVELLVALTWIGAAFLFVFSFVVVIISIFYRNNIDKLKRLAQFIGIVFIGLSCLLVLHIAMSLYVVKVDNPLALTRILFPYEYIFLLISVALWWRTLNRRITFLNKAKLNV